MILTALASAALISDSDEFQLESKVKTSTGLYERYVDPKDERRFKVLWTKDSGEQVSIVDRSERSKSVVYRRPLHGLRLTGVEEVVEWDPETRDEKILGSAKKVFHSETSCQAVALVPTPTFLDHYKLHRLKHLNCNEEGRPLPSNVSLVVETNRNAFQLPCYFSIGGFCLWVAEDAVAEESKGQLLSLVAIHKLQNFLASSKLEAFLPTLKLEAWASTSNLSFYDSQSQTIFLGTGSHPDSFDGFVVTHEWGHFLWDQLNPGVWGYDAEVLHEALSDFIASDLWQSPCFAPYDALEESNRSCVRRLDQFQTYPNDMVWSDPHQDSTIVSAAIWEGLRAFPPAVRWAILAETVISLPKNFEVHEFWDLVFESLERQNLLPGARATSKTLTEVLRRRGFLK